MRSERTVGEVRRDRLLARCADAAVVVLDAPSGYGKSTFADQLVRDRTAIVAALVPGDAGPGRLLARLGDAALAAGLLAAAEVATGDGEPADRLASFGRVALASQPGTALVLDDLHHLDADALDLLESWTADVAGALGADAGGLVVLSGRVVPMRPPGAVVVDADALAFDNDEVRRSLIGRALLGSTGDPSIDAARCRRATNGWPAAVATWRVDAVASSSPDAGLGALVDRVASWPPVRRRALVHLPLLSREVGAALGWPAMIDDLRRDGFPLRAQGAWWVLGDVVRDRLLDRAPLDRADAFAVARRYADGGLLFHAIDVLLAAGARRELASLIAAVDLDEMAQHDVSEIAATVSALPDDVLADVPEVLLQVAQAASGRILLALRRRLIDRLERLPLDPVMRRRVEVERVYDLSRDTEMDATEARGSAVLALLGQDEHLSRARCLYALGQAATMRGDPASMEQAAQQLAESAGIARSIGLASMRAKALNTLGYSVLFARGQAEAAIGRIQEAVDISPPQSRLRGTLLTFLAEVLAFVGDDDEALGAIAEANEIAARYGDTRTLAYAAWTAAKAAARRRDAAATARWLEETLRQRGEWFDHPTGAEFLAIAAELSAAVGDEPGARRFLAMAEQHPAVAEYPDLVWAAQGLIELSFGDAARAEEIVQRLLDEGWTQDRVRWQYRVWIASARLSQGDVEGARQLASRVCSDVALLGLPALPTLHEPERWPALAALVDGSDGILVAPVAEPGPVPDLLPPGNDEGAAWAVQLLGGFAVRTEHGEVEIAPGRPSHVVKLLALDGRLSEDAIADRLWPGSTIDVARRRLRNVLSRVRASAPIVERRGRDLALVTGVRVDVTEFERAARAALRLDGDERVRAAAEAMTSYTGELLPGDRFEDWTASARESVRHLAVRLLEVQVADAIAIGDADRAISVTEALLAADPYQDHWADQVADLLDAAGQPSTARIWRERARQIRAELGM